MNSEDAASLMGHSEQVHVESYKQWITAKDTESAVEKALRYREFHEKKK